MTPLLRGDRVALLVPATAAYVETVLALLARGIVPIPLDPRLTDHERRRMLAGLDPTLVVTDEVVLADLLATHRPDAPVTAWLPLARPMHCTSGTTGTPKGVSSGLLSPADARATAQWIEDWAAEEPGREGALGVARRLRAAAEHDWYFDWE